MAGNTRFHSKFHFAQHHSEVTSKNTMYPDATTDPIASVELPFQGDFHSDGVLKIKSFDADRFNYFGNDVHIDSNLNVTNNTTISGDLEVVGNVVLKANPSLLQEQRIQIGDDKGGIDQIVDLVVFESYLDSDFSPLSSLHVNLGEQEKRWHYLYVTNLDLDGAFKIGSCAKDGQGIDKGLYIDAGAPGPRARLGINTCEPNAELDIHGNVETHGHIKLDDNNSVYWDTLSAGNTRSVGISGNTERITLEHPFKVELAAPHLLLDRNDVDIKLKDSQNSLTIGDCLTHYDELNNRVGIHTCEPAVELDVVGRFQLSGASSKTYVTDEYLVESEGDALINSTSNDVEIRAGKNVAVSAPTVGIAGYNQITTTAGATHIMNSPTIITKGNRVLIDSENYVKIETPEIDISSNDVTVKLNQSATALNVHDCMLSFNTAERHIGINNCDPTSTLDVVGDVLMKAPVDTGMSGVINLSAGNYTKMSHGKVGFNVDNPEYRISLPCGDAIGTHHRGAAVGGVTPVSGSYIQFCTDPNNVGSRDMLLSNNNNSDIVLDPGRSVVIPNDNLGIGMIPRSRYALDITGDTHIQGSLYVSSLTPSRVIYKDSITLNNTTTDEFYYDGTRAALGHLPLSGETAKLYVAKGPVKLASTIGKEMIIQSTAAVDVESAGARDTTLIQSPAEHGLTIDLPHSNKLSTFSLRFRQETSTDGVYDPSVAETKFFVKPNEGLNRAFFGFNTTDQNVVDDSSGQTTAYDVIINQDANINNNLRVANNLHVENDTTVDGMLTVNSESETIGVEVRSSNGARLDLIDTDVNGIDNRYEIQSHKSMIGGEIPGAGSSFGSTISNASNDHMVFDLRNTSEDHRFALRYSSSNNGVSDKIVMSAGHYIYNIANPNYDPTQPASSTNAPQIQEERQGHVGINCIPTQDYHLDVNGNMRITGSFIVDGASTTIAAANMTVQDKNIVLNDGGTTANTFNSGIYIEGDDNGIVGYVKVHPSEIDKLVAKAPTGQELTLDINGTSGSELRLEESLVNIKKSPTSLDNSTVGLTNSQLSITNGSITVSNSADFTVETDSIIDQDLTQDSETVQFAGTYVSKMLTIPTNSGTADAQWTGSVRYNDTKQWYEGNVGGNSWVPFNGGLSDNDGDTRVTLVEGDTDALEFYVDNERVLFMDGSKAEFNTTYGFTIPAGPTSDRPAVSIVKPGSFRFNTEHNHFEGYNGSSWTQAGGVIDADRDTYWTAHEDETSGSSYPGDPDKLRAFTAGTQAFEIDNNSVKFFNAGTQHLDITQTDDVTELKTTGDMTITSDVVNISAHNGTKGLALGGTTVTATAGDLNRTDITTVGQSQNNKVLTQNNSGQVNIGTASGNQSLDVASHDEVDAGLKLAGTLVTASAAEINKLDGLNSTTTQLNYLTATGLAKEDFVKLAAVISTSTQLNYTNVGTPGTVVANRCVVVDGSKDITGFGNIGSTGNITIGGNAFVAGEVHSSSTSDGRLKHNLKKIENPLKKLSQISGYNFEWDTEAAAVSELAGADVGVIAQEVEKVVPEAVTDKDSGYKGVRYDKLIPLLIECVKDQQKQIEYLAKLVSQK